VRKRSLFGSKTEKPSIKVLDTQRLISIKPGMPPLLAEGGMVNVGKPDSEKLQILVGPDAFARIDRHIRSDTTHEVGGFLIGQPFEWEGKRYVEIVDAMEADATSSSQVHLTISSNTWMLAQNLLREKFSGMHIVGWYHTHPRMELFLSSQDLSIHEGFFREPWHVALVLDPTRQAATFFAWDDARVRETTGYQIRFPADVTEKQHWNIPAHLTSALSADLALEDFYETGCWHSRWSQGDEFVMKLRGDAVRRIERELADEDISRTGLQIGVALGRITRLRLDKLCYFIDVKGARSLVSARDGRNATLNETLKTLGNEAISGYDTLGGLMQPIGLYAILPSFDNPLLAQLPRMLNSEFRFLIFGTQPLGRFESVFQLPDQRVVEKQLIKMVSLDEFYNKDFPSVMDQARKQWKAEMT
jgi:proteasome lid subunit RPN8/RPN11